jgi:hypothetical protein
MSSTGRRNGNRSHNTTPSATKDDGDMMKIMT